ncbi:MAG: cyclic nucleotide-binding domain-containing protein [Bacteroidota bacterium]
MFAELEYMTILGATLMSVVAMVSLVVGAAIGIYMKPSHRLNAIIMAFGTGALIQALALELAFEGAERLIHHGEHTGIESWMWVSSGFLIGGLIYYLANKFLERRGAALRHPALSKLYLLEKKREESAEILKRLANVELVRSLPPEEMQDVLLCVQPVQFKQGETIFQQGDDGNALYLIDSGTIDIISGNTDSKPLAQLVSGHSFGEMALLTGEPRSASAIASTDAALLKIGKEHFDELIDRSPRLRHSVEELISQRILKNVEKAKGTVDAAHWQKVAVANIQQLSKSEEDRLRNKHASSGAPLAIFLGAMLDGIPESLVIGSSFISFESFKLTFLAAVFLANLPEAIGSAKGMKEAGFSNVKVFSLWFGLIIAGAFAAALGNIFLSTAPATALTLVGAIAGGGILAMVASVMMPEAYEDGGASVGLATIAGFLTAFLFTFI